jgi:predicted molibdopterin-dependent oxidoreductase YjgC
MARISEHPVLGVYGKGEEVEFTFDGRTLRGFSGEPVAMALRAAGVLIHRYTSKLRRPRGIFCAIGRCTDCVMIVDGKPNIRACVTPLEAGMNVRTQHGVGEKDETL